MKRAVFLILFLLTTNILLAQDIISVPVLKRQVTDLTNTLDANQINTIEGILQQFEDSTGSQVVVLIVPTTGSESIEDYSMRVAEAWKIGREGVDDGVILLIAKDDRTLRIEVGYGLESVITDADASVIISDYIVPEFKNGDFYIGIYYGIDEILNLINGGTLVSNYYSDEEYDSDEDEFAFIDKHPWLFVLMIILSMFLPGLPFAFTKKRVWIISFVLLIIIAFQLFTGYVVGLVWLAFPFILVTLAIGIIIILFRIKTKGKVSFWGSGGGNYSSSSYNSSSYSSSSYSGGSSYSSGSSYSGGGGSFGGGGASGSW